MVTPYCEFSADSRSLTQDSVATAELLPAIGDEVAGIDKQIWLLGVDSADDLGQPAIIPCQEER